MYKARILPIWFQIDFIMIILGHDLRYDLGLIQRKTITICNKIEMKATFDEQAQKETNVKHKYNSSVQYITLFWPDHRHI